jgi:hypothetical protein
MRSVIAVTIGMSVLTYAGTVSAVESVRQICPKGYAPLAEICISAATGDIVLPIKKTASAHSQFKADR